MLKTSTVLSSPIIISSFYTFLFFELMLFYPIKGLNGFPKCFVIGDFFSLKDSQNIPTFFVLVVIHNNYVVLNTSICFLHFYPLKLFRSLVLVSISLDRALFIKGIWLPLAYFCLRGACRSNIPLHVLRKSLNPSSFF